MRLRASSAALTHSVGRAIENARPAAIVVPLVALQLLAAAWFLFRTPHIGFVWYSGGDATEYWAAEYALGHFFLPQTLIGWGLPILYAWVPAVDGPTLLSGLPVILLLQVCVLLPLSVLFFWAVANRLYGRIFAACATALWVAFPFLMIWGFRDHGYRESFEHYVLAPHWYGLTNMADFPSLVVVLAAAWATLRAVQDGRRTDAVLAGLLAGFLIGLKPGNGYFLPALAVLLVGARRPRVILAWVAAFAPALVILLVWKARGLGHVPALSFGLHREALASQPVASVGLGRYVPWSPGHFHQELNDLREVFWSVRLLEFLVVAGTLGAIRRLPLHGVFVATWFLGIVFFKGSSNQSSVTTTTFFRLTLIGLPAFVLLAAATPFLVPGTRRLRARATNAKPLPLAAVVAAAIVLAVVPLAFVVLARPATPDRLARDPVSQTEMPVSNRLAAAKQNIGSAVRLSWRSVDSGHSRVQYVVMKAQPGTDGCTVPEEGARECQLAVTPVAITERPSAIVRAGPTYRIALAANFLDDPNGGDLMLVGPPIRTSS